MKKIILILSLVLISILGYSQSSAYRIKNITKFGWHDKTVPVPFYVDSTFNSLWVKVDMAVSSATIGGNSITSTTVTGATLPTAFTATATINIADTPSLTSTDNTIAIVGAEVGDVVSVGTAATQDANSSITAFVSATNVVTIRFNNYSAAAINPASATYRVKVIKN